MDIRDELGELTDRNKKTPKSKFLLSTLALIFGWLAWLGSCAGIMRRATEGVTEPEASTTPLLGLQIILGTLAYRSVKRTKLGIREESVLRRIGELVALILVWLPSYWLVWINNPSLWGADPMGNVMVPLWSYIAYLVIVMKRPQTSTVDEEPRGLGGWLILVAIGLCITPIMLGISVMRDFLPIFQEGYWEIFTTPGSAMYHRLWGPLIIFEIIGNVFFMIFSIILIFLFFRKFYRFPTLVVVFTASNVLFLISDLVFVDFVFKDLILALASEDEALASEFKALALEDDGEDFKNLFQRIISAMIWIPYLLASKRVKNTFVKQDSNKPLQSS